MTVNTKVVPMAQHKTITVDADVVACCSPIASVEMSEAEASDIAQIFSALSDPVRLRMLSMIASESQVCSCALEGPLAKSQPTISHHTCASSRKPDSSSASVGAGGCGGAWRPNDSVPLLESSVADWPAALSRVMSSPLRSLRVR